MSRGASASSREVRRQRARRLLRRVSLWVIIPTLAATVYYGIWATSQYDSVAVIAVQSAEAPASGARSLASALPRSSAGRDVQLISQYLRSREVLRVLIDQHQLAEHYQGGEADWFARLTPGASFEETYSYYLDKIEIAHDGQAGTLTLRVRAFSPDRAQELARAMLASAEEMVSRLSERERREWIQIAESRLEEAEQQLIAVSRKHAGIEVAGDPAAAREMEFANQGVDAARRSLELARAEAARQHRYLVTIAEPSLPDSASHPRRLWGIATVFSVALALMVIFTVLAGAVREHAKL